MNTASVIVRFVWRAFPGRAERLGMCVAALEIAAEEKARADMFKDRCDFLTRQNETLSHEVATLSRAIDTIRMDTPRIMDALGDPVTVYDASDPDTPAD